MGVYQIMKSILEELYALLPPSETPNRAEKEAAWAEYHSMCDQIHKTFGLKFVDRFTLFQAELEHTDEMAIFRRGFRLGVQMMAEVFSEA